MLRTNSTTRVACNIWKIGQVNSRLFSTACLLDDFSMWFKCQASHLERDLCLIVLTHSSGSLARWTLWRLLCVPTRMKMLHWVPAFPVVTPNGVILCLQHGNPDTRHRACFAGEISGGFLLFFFVSFFFFFWFGWPKGGPCRLLEQKECYNGLTSEQSVRVKDSTEIRTSVITDWQRLRSWPIIQK